MTDYYPQLKIRLTGLRTTKGFTLKQKRTTVTGRPFLFKLLFMIDNICIRSETLL